MSGERAGVSGHRLTEARRERSRVAQRHRIPRSRRCSRTAGSGQPQAQRLTGHHAPARSRPGQGADNFIEWWHKADRGELEPFVLVVEGSIPNEAIKSEGYWCGFGNNPATGQPMTTNEWLDRLAPKATAILAVGTCATYGGIHAMAGNPTGAMGVPDYLGWDWKSKAGLPIVCVPGCPVHPDNLSETILYLLYQVAGRDRVDDRERHVRHGHPQPAQFHRQDRGQGTEVAREGLRTPHRLPEDVVTR